MSAPRVLGYRIGHPSGVSFADEYHGRIHVTLGGAAVPLISQYEHDAEVARLRRLLAKSRGLLAGYMDGSSSDLDAADLVADIEKELGDGK